MAASATARIVVGSDAQKQVVAYQLDAAGSVTSGPILLSNDAPLWPWAGYNDILGVAPGQDGGFLVAWLAHSDLQGDWIAYTYVSASGAVANPCP